MTGASSTPATYSRCGARPSGRFNGHPRIYAFFYAAVAANARVEAA